MARTTTRVRSPPEILVNGKTRRHRRRERQPVKEIWSGRKNCGMVSSTVNNGVFHRRPHWPGGFDETGLRQWAENFARNFRGAGFARPRFHVAEFSRTRGKTLEICRVHARIPLLAAVPARD